MLTLGDDKTELVDGENWMVDLLPSIWVISVVDSMGNVKEVIGSDVVKLVLTIWDCVLSTDDSVYVVSLVLEPTWLEVELVPIENVNGG